MVRFVIIGIVIAVAFTLYALVDASMTDSKRMRGISKPAWVLLVAVLPVIGATLWFTLGKGQPRPPAPVAPEDDPRFSGKSMDSADLDAHMRDLEAQLLALDDEVFPGEESGSGTPAAEGAGTGTGAEDTGAEGSGSGSGSKDDGSDDTGSDDTGLPNSEPTQR